MAARIDTTGHDALSADPIPPERSPSLLNPPCVREGEFSVFVGEHPKMWYDLLMTNTEGTSHPTYPLPPVVADWTDDQLTTVWNYPQSWWIGREELATHVAHERLNRGLVDDWIDS